MVGGLLAAGFVSVVLSLVLKAGPVQESPNRTTEIDCIQAERSLRRCSSPPAAQPLSALSNSSLVNH